MKAKNNEDCRKACVKPVCKEYKLVIFARFNLTPNPSPKKGEGSFWDFSLFVKLDSKIWTD